MGAPAARQGEPALRLPAAAGTSGPGASDALRLFHLAGRDRGLPPDAMAGRGLRPAAAAGLLDAELLRGSFPLFVPADGGDPVPLLALLERAAAQAQAAGEDTTATGPRLGLVARAAEEALGSAGRGAARAVFDEAGRRFVASIDVSDKGARLLGQEWERLRARLPAEGEIIGLSADAVSVLALAAFRSRRRTAREAWLTEITRLARSLREMLRGEEARASRGAAPALGGMASTFLDLGALAGSLPAPQGPVPMGDLERSHVERAAALLERHLASAQDAPDIVFVRPQGSRLGAVLPSSLVRELAHPLQAAPALFDELAHAHAGVLRAARLARLALAGTYSPDEHDPLLQDLDWNAATQFEAMALPALIVLETGEGIRRDGMEALSRILAGNRPIHVVVEETLGAEAVTPDAPPVSLADLALAHREAFVVAGTLGNPLHLDAGLRAMAARIRPSVAIAAVPAPDAPLPPAAWAALALQARLTPCLRYDPDAGATWAERLDLSGNPRPEEDSPSREVAVDGAPAGMKLQVSYAALAIAAPAWRAHARAVGPDAWGEQQVELHEALATPGFGRVAQVPFTWAVGDDGTLVRVVVTRALMAACAGRARAWRLLRELAGIDNSHAERAAAAARAAAHAEAEIRLAQADARHAEALATLREHAAADTLDRLVSVIMNLDAGAIPAAIPAVSRAAPPASPQPAGAPAPASAPAAAAPAEEALSDEAYTDTVLCTTCNECTNINSRLFKYNANKQAHVADASAGTYAELVKAAEKCPARCIHVGAPRPGDTTVDDALLARAMPFR